MPRPFNPKKIITLAKHNKAYDVLVGVADEKHKEIIAEELELSLKEVGLITRQRSFRSYVNRLKSLRLQREIAERKERGLDTDTLDVRKAFDFYAPEAVRKLISTMRMAPSIKDQKDAAVEILDRAGYVKVQRQLNVNVDAEAVIRALNKNAGLDDDEIDTDTEDAEVVDE